MSATDLAHDDDDLMLMLMRMIIMMMMMMMMMMMKKMVILNENEIHGFFLFIKILGNDLRSRKLRYFDFQT